MTYSTVKYVPDPRRFISFYLVTPEMKNQHFNLSDASAVTGNARTHSLGDGGAFVMGKRMRGERRLCDSYNKRGLAFSPAGHSFFFFFLSLTRPRAQMSSQIQLFFANDI